MNKEIARLAARRALLTNRIEQQRKELNAAFVPFRAPLEYADKGLHLVAYIAQRPIILTGIAALAIMFKPKRWLLILENGLMIWRVALAAKRKLER